jgi:N-acetyl sugar amidotransferase
MHSPVLKPAQVAQPHLDSQLSTLPKQIGFCTRCVMSNQRPRITFDQNGVCSACRYQDEKDSGIDWAGREAELHKLLDAHRSAAGDFDVIVPCSGGKDSAYVAYTLKHKYGMRPLTVTWAPFLYTEIGRQNLDRFVASGYDNVLCTPAGDIHRRLAKHCLELVGDPFHAFVMGQIAYPFRVALETGIKLVFYGENGEAEYAGGMSTHESKAVKDLPGMPLEYFDERFLKGVQSAQFTQYGFKPGDLKLYALPAIAELRRAGVEMHWMSYYRKWTPQWNYYTAVEHTGFQANPERSEGTYSKYASLDDKMDGIHYYLKFVKFGFGRATDDASQEVRNGHLTREEAVALVHRYDGEFPTKYFQECLDYMGITENHFWEVADRYRQPHVWERAGNQWRLRQRVV